MGVQPSLQCVKRVFCFKDINCNICQILHLIQTLISLRYLLYLHMRVRKIAPVVRKVRLKDANDEEHDLEYWLTKQVKERAAAVLILYLNL